MPKNPSGNNANRGSSKTAASEIKTDASEGGSPPFAIRPSTIKAEPKKIKKEVKRGVKRAKTTVETEAPVIGERGLHGAIHILEEEVKLLDAVDAKEADNTLQWMEDNAPKFADSSFSKHQYHEVLRKLHWRLVPLLMFINSVLVNDKEALGHTTALDVLETANITRQQFNDLNSYFYVGYTVGQLLNFLLQMSPMRLFMPSILFIWGGLVLLHCAVNSYTGLVVLRTLLGAAESVIVPGLEVTLYQFFTPRQRATLQPIFWISSSAAPFIGEVMIWGLLHLSPDGFPRWKVFMIINGGVTLCIALLCRKYYPSNPVDCNFLTSQQKYFLIKKLHKQGQSSIVQKVIKKRQVIECLKDPVSWIFTLFSFCIMLANDLEHQQNLLYPSLKVRDDHTPFVGMVGNGFATIWHILAAIYIHYYPNHSSYAIFYACIPSLAGGIVMVTVPWSNNKALLGVMTFCSKTFHVAFIVALGWTASSCSGNTKRIFRHFMFMVADGISSIISPQIWKGQAKPRYYATWITQIVFSWTLTWVAGFAIRYILKKRNEERLLALDEAVKNGTYELGTVFTEDSNGEKHEKKVDLANLDLTDLENRLFIYPL